MGRPIKVLTGIIFGRLTVLELSHMNERGHAIWRCQCSCSESSIKLVRGSHLTDGNIASCGCLNREVMLNRHNSHRESMIGKTFGRLTIVSVDKVVDNHTTYYQCSCVCGGTCSVSNIHLKSGATTSCGCYAKQVSSSTHTTHGLSNHPLYNTWIDMKSRCHNPNDHAYDRYGKDGISVCSEWYNDLSVFIEWAETHGYRPGLTIDRYPNKYGNYEPSNCRWATAAEQNQNKRNNVVKDMQMARNIRTDARPPRVIADQYDIPIYIVHSIKSGKTWVE